MGYCCVITVYSVVKVFLGLLKFVGVIRVYKVFRVESH